MQAVSQPLRSNKVGMGTGKVKRRRLDMRCIYNRSCSQLAGCTRSNGILMMPFVHPVLAVDNSIERNVRSDCPGRIGSMTSRYLQAIFIFQTNKIELN